MKNPESNNGLVLSALHLRLLIGSLGIALPAICVAYSIFAKAGIEDSISAYYYTAIREVFCGILFGLGFTLFCYGGPDTVDRVLSFLGGCFALGVALFPMGSPAWIDGDPIGSTYIGISGNFGNLHGTLHSCSAILLFVTFLIFAGGLFPRTQNSKDPTALSIFLLLLKSLLWIKDPNEVGITEKKKLRNRIYRGSARVIAVALLCIGYNGIFASREHSSLQPFPNTPHWLLVWEAVALLAFGFSWITKAESFGLGDSDDEEVLVNENLQSAPAI